MGEFFYKASATLPLIKIYRMSLISAGSISLDTTLKEPQTFNLKRKKIAKKVLLRRLVCVDASRESTACLACVYLNEYRTAVAAFTLHAAELKIVRVSQLHKIIKRKNGK